MESVCQTEISEDPRRKDEAILLCLPVFSLVLGLAMVLYEIWAEPWAIFRLGDLAIQVGGSLLAVSAAFIWIRKIIQIRRPVVLFLVPVMVLGLFCAAGTSYDYFKAPWTYLHRQ